MRTIALRHLVIAVAKDERLSSIQIAAFIDAALAGTPAEKLTESEWHVLKVRAFRHLRDAHGRMGLNEFEAVEDYVPFSQLLERIPLYTEEELQARYDLARRLDVQLSEAQNAV